MSNPETVHPTLASARGGLLAIADTHGISRVGVFGSVARNDAVIRSFEILGEAAKMVSPDVRERAPDIPWRRIAGMRDKLIHEHFGVNLDLVWETVVRDVPPLQEEIDRLIVELGDDKN